ncbi:MAG: inositol monophosphatase [Patescibacteria group bacterium]
MSQPTSDFLRVACAAAQAASIFLKQAFGKDIQDLKAKALDDLSSFADKEAERMIIAQLTQNFPEHNILGEESGLVDKGSAYTWVIDPLDGTTNFVQGIPYFGCSIGLAKQGVPVLGVITSPLTGNMMVAEKGTGTWLDGEQVRVVERPLEESLVTFDLQAGDKAQGLEFIKKIAVEVRGVRLFGASVVAMMELAMGRNQCYVHPSLKDWDACAGAIIIQEAGGVVTDFDNHPWKLGRADFLASVGSHLHEKFFKLIT